MVALLVEQLTSMKPRTGIPADLIQVTQTWLSMRVRRLRRFV
jgi:hypothetical protein